MTKQKTRLTKKAKIRFAIRKALQESYGKMGYTSTADKFLKLFYKRLESI